MTRNLMPLQTGAKLGRVRKALPDFIIKAFTLKIQKQRVLTSVLQVEGLELKE